MPGNPYSPEEYARLRELMFRRLRWGQAKCSPCQGAGCDVCHGVGKALQPIIGTGLVLLPNNPFYNDAIETLNKKDKAQAIASFRR